ncbi:MAG: PilZ domain-containing protein [Omnitrophica bacterium]|nr:PilZ domain-containing protein [Candidatus Omnitrophota bacterium]
MDSIIVEVKKGYSEKRKAQRLPIPIKIDYKFLPQKTSKNTFYNTYCDNISGTGLGLSFDSYLKKGTCLKLRIHFPGDVQPVAVMAEVAWCKEVAKTKIEPCFRTGVQYTHISENEKERFTLLFCEMMMNYFILGEEGEKDRK